MNTDEATLDKQDILLSQSCQLQVSIQSTLRSQCGVHTYVKQACTYAYLHLLELVQCFVCVIEDLVRVARTCRGKRLLKYSFASSQSKTCCRRVYRKIPESNNIIANLSKLNPAYIDFGDHLAQQ